MTYSIKDFLEAGVHFGHRKNFWNPKMSPYIYGARNNIHIIDLDKTAPLMNIAMQALTDVAARNGRILFVGTKKQASEPIAAAAIRCGQYYVNHRWLGGMLTNWPTISASIETLQRYDNLLANPDLALTKKERLDLGRKREKLDRVLGGIRNMGGLPDMLFVIDTNMEKLAVVEAKKLGIPVVAIVDTNSNPDDIDYIIPGNDDARKAIDLYVDIASNAVLAGLQESMAASGVDVGALDVGEVVRMRDADSKSKATRANPGKRKPAGARVASKPSAEAPVGA